MKIGAFADKYNIKKSTVRYYTDINLLLPKTDSTYPDYDDKCMTDMDDIMRYKELGFSLDEIQEVKKMERFVFKDSNSYIGHMQSIIESKINSHKDTINEISLQIESLENKLIELRPNENTHILGLPFDTLNFLRCPLCRDKFSIQNAHIDNKQIQSGNLTCGCGHHFKIEDGIVMQTHRNSELLHKTEAEDLNHLTTLNNDHISVMKKTGENIKANIKNWDHSKGILLTNADTDVYLMSIDDMFEEDGFYIFCSFEIESIKLLKMQLERNKAPGNFLFINYLDYVPLNNNINYLIDNAGCFFDHVFGFESNSILKFMDLFTDNAEVIVIDFNTKVLNLPDKLRRKFDRESYCDIYKKVNFSILSTDEIGVLKGINEIFPSLAMVSDIYISSLLLKRNID